MKIYKLFLASSFMVAGMFSAAIPVEARTQHGQCASDEKASVDGSGCVKIGMKAKVGKPPSKKMRRLHN